MNYIQPIRRAVNAQDITTWENKYLDRRTRMEDFIDNITKEGKTEEEAKEMWIYNFGSIPPEKPVPLYKCNIINADIRITVTVLKRDNVSPGERKYEVIKLNYLYLDTYDYTRKLTVNDKGEVVFEIKHKDLSQPEYVIDESDYDEENLVVSDDYVPIKYLNNEVDYPLNYEDSGWFTNMHISTLLSKIGVKIARYDLPQDEEDVIGKPKLYISDMDSMGTAEFKFIDEAFKEKLFDSINDVFIRIETQLK